MKLLFIFFILIGFGATAQIEEVGPLTGNPALQAKAEKNIQAKANPGTFDSTFIYISDTIALPLFDEFSSDNFQTYNAAYTDPGVTFDKVFRLLDLSSVPLPNDVLYTEQMTFRRTFDVANSSFVDTYFTPISIQLGDLASYPVSYNTVSAYPPYYIYDTIDYPNDPDTIWIPTAELFQDSATQFFAPVSDQNKFWLDDEAFHNYTMAKNPWSLGVVTFDGLDAKGYPYAIGTTTSGIADHLTSKPIDMSTLSPSDSVYLTFIYQGQGLADPPEGGDSLILEFYDNAALQWNEIWRGGYDGDPDTFHLIHLRVDDVTYFTDAFQFRFKNYGGLSGSLDHYHLDFVHMRTLSGYQDSVIKDFAFSYPINTLIKDYTSVPWDHYQNNFSGKMSDAVQIVVRNSNNVNANNSLGGSVEVSYGGVPEGNFTMTGTAMSAPDLDYIFNKTYVSSHDFSAGYFYPETKPGIEEEWDITGLAQAQFPNFNGNDTTYSKQTFKNYYSYDDGSAELAYGPTGVQARLAIQYTPYEADSVLGMMIHFVPSVYDVSNNLFLLTVWDDNAGEPGQVIYEDDVFFPRQPKYEYDRNIFAYYFFEDTVKIPVNGTFYVGWRQFDPERLNVGLDANIDNSDKTYYSVDNGNTWDQSTIPGSVMIRPIFSTEMDVTLGIKNKTQDISRTVLYPNPTTSLVTIQADIRYEGVEVYNMQGQMIIRSLEHVVDLSTYDSGIYIFKMINSSEVHKIVKR